MTQSRFAHQRLDVYWIALRLFAGVEHGFRIVNRHRVEAGVAVEGSSKVTAGGAGGITITGAAGNGTSNNDGVYLAANTSVQATGGGSVTIEGTGNGSHSYNRGVDAVRDLDQMCVDVWRWQSNNPQGFE